MSHRISKTINDYCLTLYTLLSYINLKIFIHSGDDSKFYFRVNEFCKKKGGFSHVAPYLRNYYYYYIILHTQDNELFI